MPILLHTSNTKSYKSPYFLIKTISKTLSIYPKNNSNTLHKTIHQPKPYKKSSKPSSIPEKLHISINFYQIYLSIIQPYHLYFFYPHQPLSLIFHNYFHTKSLFFYVKYSNYHSSSSPNPIPPAKASSSSSFLVSAGFSSSFLVS